MIAFNPPLVTVGLFNTAVRLKPSGRVEHWNIIINNDTLNTINDEFSISEGL